MQREALRNYLDTLLETPRFRDYCPNGLQVEGRSEVRHLVCGVTASQALIDAAQARGADGLLVHHGWFWKAEDGRVTGHRRRRLASLLAHDLNLFAFHLPLDAHAELGNNAQLARRLDWEVTRRFGDQELGFCGQLARPQSAAELAKHVARVLGREPQLLGAPERSISRVAWCSGGAQGYFEAAIQCGVDLFMSGEVSEQCTHLARECGVAYLAAGHHATERYGVQALGEHLERNCGIRCEFVDIDNPV
jgi:dinuclear metal center YbgI/SA1388 family protein